METTIKCRYCNGTIETEDAYCRYCGKRLGGAMPFRYTHAGIIVFSLLFGPVALPFILKSPGLGKRGRAAYLFLNITITVVMIVSIAGIYGSINRQVRETMKIIEQTGVGVAR